jgi:hypothetical protein
MVSDAPSAISTGGRSIWGSPCAKAPPTVATFRTLTLDKVSNMRVMSGACLPTSAERSRSERVVIVPMLTPVEVTVMSAYVRSIFRRLTSFAGRNTPAFIISMSAVPPAMGRIVSSSGSRSFIAAASDVGSASSNGIIWPTFAATPRDRIVGRFLLASGNTPWQRNRQGACGGRTACHA